MKKIFLLLACSFLSTTEGFSDPIKIPAGYYKGEFPSGTEADIFVIRRKAGIFGVITWENDETKGGALFKIDELKDGTQYWKHVFQKQDFALSMAETMDASFRVQRVSNLNEDPKIRLVPTPHGKSLKCNHVIEAEFDSGGPKVQAFPKNGIVLEDESEVEGTMNPQLLAARFPIGEEMHDGDFQLESWFPGLQTAHARFGDAESKNGFSVSDRISAVVLTLFDDNGIWQGYYKAHLLDLGVGTEFCFFTRGELEEE